METKLSVLNAVPELSSFHLFKDISKDDLLQLCANGTVKVHQHRDLVFRSGDPANFFGVAISGAYKLSKLNHLGHESIIYFASPGDVVAALVMPAKVPEYPVDVTALGCSRMLLLPREIYINYWMKRPPLIGCVQQLLSSRMARLHSLKTMQRAPLTSRVASLLLDLSQEDTQTRVHCIPLPLTRKEIADTLEVTVESVIRIMSDWTKQGLITTKDSSIHILNLDPLKQLMRDVTTP